MALLKQGEGTGQSCVAIIDGSDKPFFLSFASFRGNSGRIKCLQRLQEGTRLHILPLESEEEGVELTAQDILDSREKREAQVTRRESGARYVLRIIDHQSSHLQKQVRSGSLGHSELSLDVSHAGPVTTLTAEGELVINTAARLADLMKSLSREHKKILVDLSGITMLASIGIGMLVDGFQGVQKNGAKSVLLIDPTNPIMTVFGSTRLMDVIPTYTARDEAVAALIMGD